MLPFWFDPPSLLMVVVGTVAMTALRCGIAECGLALRGAWSLLAPPFDRVEAKAEMAKQVREIAYDGFVRAEPHHMGDGEFDNLADLLISRRSIDAMMSEHERYKQERTEVAQRARTVFETAAEAGPVMGLAGTLLALASQRGEGGTELLSAVGMAVMTTLYGLVLAHLVFAPLAAAIARRNLREEADRDAVLAWLDHGLRSVCSRMVDDRPSAARVKA